MPAPTAPAVGEPAAGAAPAFLAVSRLTKRFGAQTVVDDVSFTVEPGAFVCVLGPSGCGKTTLLRLLAGFERADGGQIVQASRDITRLAPEARDYGIVFQSYALFPNRTVGGNVGFGLEATGVARAERRMRVAQLLALVGLTDHASKYPSQLSGGQQQRVALARALALSPGLLLLDEPLSALDANVRAHLRDELRALQQRVGVTTLMVTHDQQEALSIADQLIVMNKGRIEQQGRPFDVFAKPANLFVARFLGEMNALPIEGANERSLRAGGLDFAAVHLSDTSARQRYLCIRPAEVLIGRDAQGEANAFEGTVGRVRFLGDTVRIEVRLATAPGPETAIEVESPRARLDAVPSPGERVTVALPPRHLIVLDDTTGAAPAAGSPQQDRTP